MDPHEEPFRCPRNWDVLRALESLSPPSPSGSLEAFASFGSSGEIPILLHSGCEQDNRSSVLSMSTAPRSRPQSRTFLKPSTSLATFNSTNTFGISKPLRNQVDDSVASTVTSDDASDRTTCRFSLRVPPPSGPSTLTLRSSRSGDYWNNRFSTISNIAALSAISVPANSIRPEVATSPPCEPGLHRPSPSVPFSICASDSIVISPAEEDANHPYPSPTVFDSFRFPPSESLQNNSSIRALADLSSRSWSTMSSALFVRRRVSSSSTTTTVNSENFAATPIIHFRSPLLRNSIDLHRPRLRSDSPVSTLPYSSPSCDTPPYTSVVVRPPPHNPDAAPPSSCVTEETVQGSGSGHSRTAKLSQSAADLPEVLSWIRDICFELWIDQEGFRAIRPQFRLVGYTPSPISATSPADDLANTLTYGVAMFRPVRRVTSAYHHGTLDSTPVLRRLTLADSEDKDYISRQASLTIKANGVYCVTGMESFEDHPPTSPGLGTFLSLGSEQQQPSLQLQWRFEYVVDDRKTDTGRAIPGEKTLTSLSFSCSPGLLHPSHGKRIRLMHVLKKTLVPKLSAAKVANSHSTDAVESNKTSPSVSLEDCSQQNSAPSPRVAVRRSLPGTLHRRARSSEPAEPASVWSPPATDGYEDARPRARPASITGVTRQRAGSLTQDPTEPQDLPALAHVRHAAANAPGSARLSRHILSREELSAILASFPSPSDLQPTATATASLAVIPLSPPSYYRHRRFGSSIDRADEMGVVVS